MPGPLCAPMFWMGPPWLRQSVHSGSWPAGFNPWSHGIEVLLSGADGIRHPHGAVGLHPDSQGPAARRWPDPARGSGPAGRRGRSNRMGGEIDGGGRVRTPIEIPLCHQCQDSTTRCLLQRRSRRSTPAQTGRRKLAAEQRLQAPRKHGAPTIRGSCRDRPPADGSASPRTASRESTLGPSLP